MLHVGTIEGTAAAARNASIFSFSETPKGRSCNNTGWGGEGGVGVKFKVEADPVPLKTQFSSNVRTGTVNYNSIDKGLLVREGVLMCCLP